MDSEHGPAQGLPGPRNPAGDAHVVGLADVAIVEHMGRIFELHPLALEDVLTLGQRPKTEEFDDTLFCIVQHLTYRPYDLQKVQLALFLGEDFVLTFQPHGEDLLAPPLAPPVCHRLLTGRPPAARSVRSGLIPWAPKRLSPRSRVRP